MIKILSITSRNSYDKGGSYGAPMSAVTGLPIEYSPEIIWTIVYKDNDIERTVIIRKKKSSINLKPTKKEILTKIARLKACGNFQVLELRPTVERLLEEKDQKAHELAIELGFDLRRK